MSYLFTAISHARNWQSNLAITVLTRLIVNFFLIRFLYYCFCRLYFSHLRILLWNAPTPMYVPHTCTSVLSFSYINKPPDIIHMQCVIRVLSLVFDWQLNQLGVTVRLRVISRFFGQCFIDLRKNRRWEGRDKRIISRGSTSWRIIIVIILVNM